MTREIKEKEELVLVGHWMFHGGGGLQQWWWRRISFVSLMILPFEVVSADSDWWDLQKIEKEEVWALFEVIWPRKQKVMRI